MPSTLNHAIQFLETQWSSINDNKVKGIISELALKEFLIKNNHHFVPGGWVLVPGNPSLSPVPTREKLCILPRGNSFSWNNDVAIQTLAEISAYSHFRQVGMKALFAIPTNVVEENFSLPKKSNGRIKANYPRSYNLQFFEISPTGKLIEVSFEDAFRYFPKRTGNKGLRCNATNRLNLAPEVWRDPSVISDLFWFEYAKYFIQVDYLVSNNDLDLFLIGPSGRSYPVELKSKTVARDKTLGEWFGIDMGPFAKLSFFTSNSMNNDALYIVEEIEEIDKNRMHIEWYGITFSQLVKSCSWVGQGGGRGMTGGRSSTYKVPKSAFTQLSSLLKDL